MTKANPPRIYRAIVGSGASFRVVLPFGLYDPVTMSPEPKLLWRQVFVMRTGSTHKSMPLECPDMSGPGNEEYANLYMRGVNEAASGMELDAQDVLDVLDAFGGDGVRWYLIGVLEGSEDRVEQETEEYEMLEASVAYVVHESSVSILEESEDTLRIWLEEAPKDLGTGINLRIVHDDDEVVNGGRIIAVEFKDTTDHDIGEDREAIQDDAEEPGAGPAIVTVEKWKYEIVEYSDPEDGPIG